MINILRGDGHNHNGKYIIIDMYITKNKMLCCAHLSYYIFPSYGSSRRLPCCRRSHLSP